MNDEKTGKQRVARLAVLATIVGACLLLASGAALAGKGGEKGKPGGGGGGEDPEPACTGWVYSLWRSKTGYSSSSGLARVCLDGSGSELLTQTNYGWNTSSRIELSPDGTHIVDSHSMAEIANAETRLAFDDTDLPEGFFPTWSWRVDGAGDPLPSTQQFVAVTRALPLGDRGTTTQDVFAFHPFSGAAATRLTELPADFTETAATVYDPVNDVLVQGSVITIERTVNLTDLSWLAGNPNNPDVSWIVFWTRTVEQEWDAIPDPDGERFVQQKEVFTESWQVLAVETGTDAQGNATLEPVAGSLQPFIPSGDLADVDVLGGTTNLRFSKSGSHAIWQYDQGHKRAALAYDAADVYAVPSIDTNSIVEIDPAAMAFFGGVPFYNLAISRDGSRLAIGNCEVWVMDIDVGEPSLVRISERSRKNHPCYAIQLDWSE